MNKLIFQLYGCGINYRIRLKSRGNGKILWVTSESYKTRANAVKAYVLLQKAVRANELIDLTRKRK